MEFTKSGIDELDKLLGGGLVKEKIYLLESVVGTKPRFFISAFFRRGYANNDKCRIDSFDYSFSDVVEDMEGAGFSASKAASEGRFIIVDYMNDKIYGTEVDGPYFSAASSGLDVNRAANLGSVAWDKLDNGKTRTNGLRIVLQSLTSIIRKFGFEDSLKYIDSLIAPVTERGGILLATLNPETISLRDLAVIEEVFDGVIELTVREEKTKFQRYVRVKDSPSHRFVSERLPYEIVGEDYRISIASKLMEDFDSLKENMKMTAPGVVDLLGDRCLFQGTLGLGILHRLVFEEVGYERAFDLLYRWGFDYVENATRHYIEMMNIDISELSSESFDIVGTFFKFISLRGYGELKTVEVDKEKRKITLRVLNSPIGSELRGFGRSVDAFIAGAAASAARVVMQGDTSCKETRCIAKGDECCEFEVSQA